MAPTRKAEATIRTTLLNNSATKAAITSSFEYCSSLACDKYLRKMKNRPNSNSIRPKQGRIPSSISNGIRSFSCVIHTIHLFQNEIDYLCDGFAFEFHDAIIEVNDDIKKTVFSQCNHIDA